MPSLVDLSLLAAPMPVSLWRAALDCAPSSDALAFLSAEEHARATRFVFERDQRRYRAAHCALRHLLAQSIGQPAGQLRFERGPYGKPALVESGAACHFNMSHSEDIALIAVSRQVHVGVDVERWRELPDAPRLIEIHFTEREQDEWRRLPQARLRHLAFLRGWTRKEACLKALGSGLSIEPRSFETGLAPHARQVRIRVGMQTVQVRVQSFCDGADMVGAVACIAPAEMPAMFKPDEHWSTA